MSYLNAINNKKKVQREQSYYDKNLLWITIFLVVIGVVCTFSAMVPKIIRAGGNPFFLILHQVGYALAGIIIMMKVSTIDYKRYIKWVIPFGWLVVFFLFLVKFTPMGVTVNGARRWLGVSFFQFQPSELAKPAISALLACAFYNDPSIFNSDKIIKYFLPIICMILLIMLQPNLSMVLLLALTCCVIYWCSGGNIKLLVLSGIAGICALPLVMHSYQLGRIQIWLNPDIDPRGAGFNIIQSIMAFVSGGAFGTGFGNSKQKLGWLPEGHTDFIFAVYSEEFGFIGAVILIILFLAFIQHGFNIAMRCDDMFGKILALGITSTIAIQTFINMSVASSMIPATGVTLPFISYGGTSLVISLIMVGILLSISRKKVIRIRPHE